METERTRRGRTFLHVVGVLGAVATGYAGLRYLARLRVAKKRAGHSETAAAGASGRVSTGRPAVQPVHGSETPERAQSQVGGVAEERHTGGGEHVVKGEHELWFHPDPKIEHIPPGTRTSFREDDPRANTPTPPES